MMAMNVIAAVSPIALQSEEVMQSLRFCWLLGRLGGATAGRRRHETGLHQAWCTGSV